MTSTDSAPATYYIFDSSARETYGPFATRQEARWELDDLTSNGEDRWAVAHLSISCRD